LILVSVVMSVFNGEKYLQDSIESILKQSYSNYEFIIIDDGSTDTSKEIIQRYSKQDKRIYAYYNETNTGLADCLNYGIKQSSGVYIVRQDADDISEVRRIEKQIRFLTQNPDIKVLGSLSTYIDINGSTIYHEKRKYTEKYDTQTLTNILLSQKAIFSHGTAVISKNAIERIGVYDSDYYYTQDCDLWLRFINEGYRIAIFNEHLYRFRIMPTKTNKKATGQKLYTQYIRNKYLPHAESTVTHSDIIDKINENYDDIPMFLTKYYFSLLKISIAKRLYIPILRYSNNTIKCFIRKE
jgi:glycosyltransferase involved in cell wall biosynthesis